MDQSRDRNFEEWIVEITPCNATQEPIILIVFTDDEESMFTCAQVLSACYY